MAFVQEGGKDKINFILQFKGAQDPTLQKFIYGILIENVPRAIVNGEISIIVGPLAVFDDSLAINQATVTYSLPPESTTPSSRWPRRPLWLTLVKTHQTTHISPFPENVIISINVLLEFPTCLNVQETLYFSRTETNVITTMAQLNVKC